MEETQENKTLKQDQENLVKCRNCTYHLPKKIRRCPYCGILNPTVTVKEVIVTTLAVVVVMYFVAMFVR